MGTLRAEDVTLHVQVKRLLLPLMGQDNDAPQRLCLLDFLCTVVPLRDSVVRLVLDKMIQCCSPEGLQNLAASAAPPARPPKHAARVAESGAHVQLACSLWEIPSCLCKDSCLGCSSERCRLSGDFSSAWSFSNFLASYFYV